jgi:riboflavin kinase/FMN adenylyltransferase
VTIGVFDGVHRGHQRLITDMVKEAHLADSTAVVLTFEPHPAVTLRAEDDRPSRPPLLLTTVEERAELLSTLGLDLLVVLSFTIDTVRIPAADFVDMLMRHLHMAELWGGADFALGHRREGDMPFLRRLGEERGFSVRIVAPFAWEGDLVSSSRVRAALRAGDIRQARGCLGRPYRLLGIVEEGDVDDSAGGPIVTLSPPPERLIPADGTYACLARTEHVGTHPAVTVIENPSASELAPCPHPHVPTPGQEGIITVRLVGVDADLRKQTLELDFLARLRGEQAALYRPRISNEYPNNDNSAVDAPGLSY